MLNTCKHCHRELESKLLKGRMTLVHRRDGRDVCLRKPGKPYTKAEISDMDDLQKTIYKAIVNGSYDPSHLNTRG